MRNALQCKYGYKSVFERTCTCAWHNKDDEIDFVVKSGFRLRTAHIHILTFLWGPDGVTSGGVHEYRCVTALRVPKNV